MSRHDKRATSSAKRKTPPVSAALVQKQLRECQAALEQCRLVLLAVIKSQGRVRVDKALLAEVQPGADAVEGRDVGDAIVFTFIPSNMAVPGGVSGGKPREAG